MTTLAMESEDSDKVTLLFTRRERRPFFIYLLNLRISEWFAPNVSIPTAIFLFYFISFNKKKIIIYCDTADNLSWLW